MKDLYNLFTLFVEKETYHQEDLFYSLEFKDSRFQIVNKGDLDKAVTTFLNKCPKCGQFHTSSIYSIYKLLNNELKNILKLKIEIKLENEFDTELYYNSVMQNIIDYKKLFPVYLSNIKPLKSRSKAAPFFSYGEITYHKFNQLINLVYKFNIKLPKTVIAEYRGMSDYYDWLLEIDKFDYKKFNPLWIIQYPTSYYLTRIFKQAQVRKEVKKYLRNNYQPTLAKYYTAYV
jgi:hypothetical protein